MSIDVNGNQVLFGAPKVFKKRTRLHVMLQIVGGDGEPLTIEANVKVLVTSRDPLFNLAAGRRFNDNKVIIIEV